MNLKPPKTSNMNGSTKFLMKAVCADLKSLANKVNNYFVSLTDGFEALKYCEPTIQPFSPDLLVSLSEAHTSLSSLNTSKAIDPDMIPN